MKSQAEERVDRAAATQLVEDTWEKEILPSRFTQLDELWLDDLIRQVQSSLGRLRPMGQRLSRPGGSTGR